MAAVRTCPSEVKDDEWALVAPYRCPMREDAPRRDYALRDLFNALRYLARTGCRTGCRPGPRSTSSGRAGEMRGQLRLSYTI